MGAFTWLRRARRRHAEDRLVAEASPRVHARLAGLRGGVAPQPSAPNYAPEIVRPPTPVARPRSISSALVPWAGARAAASRAASVAVTHGYDLRSGEASIMRRAPMALDADLWRSQELQGPGGRPPADPRWRMWRDASAALVAFALVGLVLLGGDLLRLPSGPAPATPGLAAVAMAGPTTRPTRVPAPTADPSVSLDPFVLTTPTPGPTATPAPAAAATPPDTGPTAHATPPPTKRPTPTPKRTPRPTPTLDAAFFCNTYTPVALVTIHCQVADNGGTVTYQWLASDDGGSTFHAVPDNTHQTLDVSFAVPGYYSLEVQVTRGSTTVTSVAAAITVGPIL
jgi:hypothetical protein